ncbi:probable mitochondrial-processing peptidase subunit beta, mitochondrial [Lycium barbarum]|uniref:probable mitochondrial-processing peptidase subunit beta, mitochondrial n=1 Tax=Lycium barbarum TaxID=112863 RepID=UPI00293E1226|nr:probable mitochondrial-processing peptidase subunit beta, mitochondrial [Lycium barbarum]
MMAFNTNYKDTGLFGVYTVAKLKSCLMLHIDGTGPVAEDIEHQLLTYDRRIPVTELFARIDAVDASTIKRVANIFILDQDVAISTVLW